MILFRGVDENNDWMFGSGLQSYYKNNDAIMANIKTDLQLFYQECYFAPQDGVPWFAILGQKNKTLFEITLQNAILKVEGVTRCNYVNLVLDQSRKASIIYSVDTIYTTQLASEVSLL